MVTGIAGFISLGIKEGSGFTPSTSTLAALLFELLPFLSLGLVLATLFVTFRAINLDRWFAKTAEAALPNTDDQNGPVSNER